MTEPSRHDRQNSSPRPMGLGRRGVLFAGTVVLVALALLVASLVHEPTVPAGLEQPLPGPPEHAASLVPEAAASPRLPQAAAPRSADNSSETPSPLAPSVARPNDGPVGIHAFPPLGTRPQLTGMIVPDDFELPPGYVRHFQSSDDGQRLPPILMYDPLNPPLDEFGEPIEMPADRVVPTDRAPAGMPVDMLELPERPETNPHSLRGLFRPGG